MKAREAKIPELRAILERHGFTVDSIGYGIDHYGVTPTDVTQRLKMLGCAALHRDLLEWTADPVNIDWPVTCACCDSFGT